jgi:hypothetical protein
VRASDCRLGRGRLLARQLGAEYRHIEALAKI